MKRILQATYAVALIAASSMAFIPAQANAQVGVNIIIGGAPPPPRYEVVPVPRPGYIWAPGYWDWVGGRHVWRTGNWARARPGYQYNRPQWVQHGGRWELNRGGWAQGPRNNGYHGNGRGYDNHHGGRNDYRGGRDR
ncbi:YXWGXW repeat-containing protein [Glaciimonas soli]|uniref:YXWGXW repeat-containing protein n=1 Tax=Glaciimonas soli TaxID=2590999 RepID=A0A843YRW6_9BURK|nr:YXWGXW repeat-containing protein [Glaciimonas soli]MQR00002.1 hypothetical protein [Glaciimonas soli]